MTYPRPATPGRRRGGFLGQSAVPDEAPGRGPGPPRPGGPLRALGRAVGRADRRLDAVHPGPGRGGSPSLHVAVLGAGIMGASTSLFLARRGARVTLFDAAKAPFSGASRWNEGKIHLGFLYAADPSLRTARRILPGGLAFRRLVEDLVGRSLEPAITPGDDLYLVHRDSVTVSLFVRTARAVDVPSAVVGTGPYGDVKNYGGRDFYVSWYPAGLVACGRGVEPPKLPPLTASARAGIEASIWRGLGEVLPPVRAIAAEAVTVELRGGWAFALGGGLPGGSPLHPAPPRPRRAAEARLLPLDRHGKVLDRPLARPPGGRPHPGRLTPGERRPSPGPVRERRRAERDSLPRSERGVQGSAAPHPPDRGRPPRRGSARCGRRAWRGPCRG